MKVVILIPARFASSRFPGKSPGAFDGDQAPVQLRIGVYADRRAALAGLD